MKSIPANKIYQEQYLLLALISVITLKVVMLPQYLVSTAGHNSYLTMAFLIAVEAMMIAVVYGITKNSSLLELDIPKWLKGVFAVLVFASSAIKCTVLGSEGVAYISTSLYANVTWAFITLALILVCSYLAHKGAKVLGRTCQIFFWMMLFALVFYVTFSNFDFDTINLMPFEVNADLAVAGDKYIMWFGDFTPLLFMSVCPSSNNKKKRLMIWTIATVIALFACTVGLMIAFICIFGESGSLVGNAFLTVSSLNKIAYMIGSMDLPTVCSWLFMFVIKFSLLLYAMSECAKFFFGNKAIISAVCGIIVYVIIVFGIGNLKTDFNLATGWLRYFVLFAELGVVIAAYIAMRISKSKTSKKSADVCAAPSGGTCEKIQNNQ